MTRANHVKRSKFVIYICLRQFSQKKLKNNFLINERICAYIGRRFFPLVSMVPIRLNLTLIKHK